MAISKYIPDSTAFIKVAVSLAILALLFKYLPIPASIRDLFRL